VPQYHSIRPVRDEGESGTAALAEGGARARACSSSTDTCLVSSASRRAISATCGYIKKRLISKTQIGQWCQSDVTVVPQRCYSVDIVGKQSRCYNSVTVVFQESRSSGGDLRVGSALHGENIAMPPIEGPNDSVTAV
jgi:hypothetical protein